MFSLTPEQIPWLVAALSAMALLLPAILFRRRLAAFLKQRRLGQAIRRLGPKVHHDLLLPDGIDGVLVADYVVLTHKGILLVTVNWYEGNIFGGKDTDQWTQVWHGASHRFTNPLHELQLICATVRSLVPNIPVSGIVLFAGNCAFPKDKPDGACLLQDLPRERRKQVVPPRFETAWELLLVKAEMLSFG
ncbi:nuclease-related domain-containing protein [Sedimenticola hydrogenitrophicus]|uniref:nuclease-related domain-containing protein n=1 Tax=Sedimenticola hydrogenitrophicus TaxID=2967975 RepID=UPI0023AF2595|nr:nuclease-related domain-containing protein [Sedimenticola hydrogenitrophicus]